MLYWSRVDLFAYGERQIYYFGFSTTVVVFCINIFFSRSAGRRNRRIFCFWIWITPILALPPSIILEGYKHWEKGLVDTDGPLTCETQRIFLGYTHNES